MPNAELKCAMDGSSATAAHPPAPAPDQAEAFSNHLDETAKARSTLILLADSAEAVRGPAGAGQRLSLRTVTGTLLGIVYGVRRGK